MAETAPDSKVYATFGRLNDLKKWQDELLSLDLYTEPTDEEDTQEGFTFQKLSVLFSEYQEQSYLLDPYLEELVTPVVEVLKSHMESALADSAKNEVSPSRIFRVTYLLYQYVKFRGYKTIVRFFPHEVGDLGIVLKYSQLPHGLTDKGRQWPLRYVILLWLYIICIIPFDLSQFDEVDEFGKTAKGLEILAKKYLGMAGLERNAAALLLARLYTRKDAGSGLANFVNSSLAFFENPASNDVMTAIGILQVLCEVAKSGSAEGVHAESSAMLRILMILKEQKSLSINTIVRKYGCKLISRVGLRLLPGRSTIQRRKVRSLTGETPIQSEPEDFDVPDEVDGVLEKLFESLQDKDTIVRWSSAKGVARIAERLPEDFASQVVETVLGFFEIHSVAAGTLYDLPAVAEATWHGACLACAELARRSLVEPQFLPRLIEWSSKALYFDLRKGAHSIGSNVRDAAAYILWALARTQNKDALVHHVESLAQTLAAVALFDREVHIRRAASAAFQEHVGRTSLFPHGIDVLGKTDFYAVSIRKHAFLIAAPEVAVHEEYREALFDHLLNVAVRHWDVVMRDLAAQSLRLVCLHDFGKLSPIAIERSVRLLDSLDLTDTHGGLCVLCEIAIGFRNTIQEPSVLDEHLRTVFKHLGRIPEKVLTAARHDLVAAAACRLVAHSITPTEIELGSRSSVPGWRKVVLIGLKHRNVAVQEAAALAMAQVSNSSYALEDISRLIEDMKTGPPLTQQSLSRLLGVINWEIHISLLPKATAYLLDRVQSMSKADIETRRSCFQAFPKIVECVSQSLLSNMSSDVLNDMLDALLAGLDDYTTDERGDVGSWVRIACIHGAVSIVQLLCRKFVMEPETPAISELLSYLPPPKFHTIAAGILKQGMERLDNVRQEAGNAVLKLMELQVNSELEGVEPWRLNGITLLKELFGRSPEINNWNDASWLFPLAVRLLEIPEYRRRVLAGIVMSIGSRTDSTQKPVATSLITFSQGLPLIQDSTAAYSLSQLVSDLISHAKANINSNAVVIPVMQTFVVLFEGDALSQLLDEPNGMQSAQTLMNMATRNIDKIKNVQRIHESMKIAANLLTFKGVRDDKVDLLSKFLGHPFPRVRAMTAEYLYVLLQTSDFVTDTDALEGVLLETEWLTEDEGSIEVKAKEVVEMIRGPL